MSAYSDDDSLVLRSATVVVAGSVSTCFLSLAALTLKVIWPSSVGAAAPSAMTVRSNTGSDGATCSERSSVARGVAGRGGSAAARRGWWAAHSAVQCCAVL